MSNLSCLYFTQLILVKVYCYLREGNCFEEGK
jgi:hypothetical protein